MWLDNNIIRISTKVSYNMKRKIIYSSETLFESRKREKSTRENQKESD